jgi:CRISP-associated protein Cas1
MIKRIIEISRAKTYLSIKLDQLIIRQGDEISSQIPCEDIGLLIVDHNGTTYTHSVFTTLLEAGAAIVLCGCDHHPVGMFLPTMANSIQTARMKSQLSAKEPLKKQLWKQIIKTKIKHQAKVLGPDQDAHKGLLEMARQVRSGDPENKEAHASRLYWKYFISEINFRRGRDGAPPNNMLNYGYAIVRAAVARAIVGAGLNPSMGIHHHNKYNAFCLADDLLEPFRGFVDAKVLEVWSESPDEDDFAQLTQPIKARLLEVLYQEVKIGQYSGPLMVGLHRTAASLVKCCQGEQKQLDLPKV